MWPQIQLTIEFESLTALSVKTLLSLVFLLWVSRCFGDQDTLINLIERKCRLKYIPVTSTNQYLRQVLFNLFFLSLIPSLLIILSANINVNRLSRNVFLLWFILRLDQFVIIKKAQITKLNLIDFIEFCVPNVNHLILSCCDDKNFFVECLKYLNTVNHLVIMSILLGYYVLSIGDKDDIPKVITGYDVALYLAF